MNIDLTNKPITSIREKLGLSQNEFALALKITQPQVSRMEAAGKVLTLEQQATLGQFFQDKGISELFAEKPLAGAQAKLSKAADLICDLQEVTGDVAGIFIGRLLPKRMQRAILQRLVKQFDVLETPDAALDEKKQKALAAGKIGQQVCSADDRIRIAAREGRWDDILLIAPAVLGEVSLCSEEVRSALAPLGVKIMHQWAMAVEIREKDYSRARQMLDEVFENPFADNRDKSAARYEKAFCFIEEHKRAVEPSPQIRIDLSNAETWLLEAHQFEPSDSSAGYGVVHLADLVLGLGEEKWALKLMDYAKDMFARADITPLTKLISSVSEARVRWPNLSKKHRVLRDTLKWLTAVAIAFGMFGSSAFAHRINRAPEPVADSSEVATASVFKLPLQVKALE